MMIPKALTKSPILGASSSASMALHFCRTRNRSVVDPSVIRLFSTSSWPPPPPPPGQVNGERNDNTKPGDSTSLASYFSSIKPTLKNQQKTAAPNPDSIRSYLSEFRGVSDSQSPRQSSFKFKTESFPKQQDGATTAPGTPSYDMISKTLRQLGANTGANDFSRRSRIEDSNTGPRVTGGTSDWLPMPGLNENVEQSSGKSESRTAFEKKYSTTELGEKLRKLRPDGRDKEGWFSLTELNERLVKLKEMEKAERERTRRDGFFSYEDLRRSLSVTEEEKKIKNGKIRLSLLGNYDSTQDFMPSSLKEHLVEKYFHPDNMSSAEKMKIELAKVREEFKMSESDCGSFRVQVAQLTTKIKHLSDALHKKDKHSRKGLQAMVERRKKLLKYLRRTDWDSYCFVLSKLGLRDNPEFRQSNAAGKKKLLSR